MKTHLHFDNQQRLCLFQAILFYSVSKGQESEAYRHEAQTFATSHAISLDAEGRPSLSAGVPLDVESVNLAIRQLAGDESSLEYIHPTLLAKSPNAMLWHRPPAPARMWFDAAAFDRSTDSKALQELNGEIFPQPHMIFARKGHELYVFAVQGDDRPTPSTPLYKCPHWNIYEGGRLCVGSSRLPRTCKAADIPAIEKGYFDSRFTHAHSTCMKGSFAKNWREIHEKQLKRFPDRLLLPEKDMTIGHLLKSLR